MQLNNTNSLSNKILSIYLLKEVNLSIRWCWQIYFLDCVIYLSEFICFKFLIIINNIYFQPVTCLHALTAWVLKFWPRLQYAFTIEIGLEHACFVVLVYFFSSFEHAKTCWLWAPTTLKNCLLKCDFLLFNYE